MESHSTDQDKKLIGLILEAMKAKVRICKILEDLEDLGGEDGKGTYLSEEVTELLKNLDSIDIPTWEQAKLDYEGIISDYQDLNQ